MTCPRCRLEMPLGANVCGHCGYEPTPLTSEDYEELFNGLGHLIVVVGPLVLGGYLTNLWIERITVGAICGGVFGFFLNRTVPSIADALGKFIQLALGIGILGGIVWLLFQFIINF